MRNFYLFLLLLFFLGACSVDAPDDAFVQSDEGGALLAEATRAAVRAINDRKTATVQSATMSAGQTREFVERSGTGTAQALRVREQEMNLNATANAIGLQQRQTSQAATETSDARRNEATGTAQVNQAAASETAIQRAANRSGSRTAAAVDATSTAYAATSTRSAQEIAALAARDQATATAEALQLEITKAKADAENWATWWQALISLSIFLIAISGIALVFILIWFMLRSLNDQSLRRRLIETKAGTVLITPLPNGQYAAQIVMKPTRSMLDEPDEENFSEVGEVENAADNLLKLGTSRGETYIPKTDPEEEEREQLRLQAMRLLRESIHYYAEQKIEPSTIARIPTHSTLGWSSERWTRAVAALKPFVITKEGRGGGTCCGPEYPNLVELFGAVSERRINLSPQPLAAAA